MPFGSAALSAASPSCVLTMLPFQCMRHAYLQSLPRREYLPVFWTEEELMQLQGTEAAGKAEADRCLFTFRS